MSGGVYKGTFTQRPGELRFTTNGTRGFVNGDVDGDSSPDFSLLVFNFTAMSAGDFVL